MKFTLTYDGELRSNGKPHHKQAIREQLSPQLEELWKISLPLQYAKRHRWVPRVQGFMTPTVHHSVDDPYSFPDQPPPARGKWLDTLQPIEVKGQTYVPLIRDSLALHCALKILYLRKEEPGRLIHQGGDIDNRLKTLFDALSVPNQDQAVTEPAGQPLHCLLEDDRLISGFSIETQRLLTRPNANEHEVRLVIEVDVRVVQARPYNLVFLGD